MLAALTVFADPANPFGADHRRWHASTNRMLAARFHGRKIADGLADVRYHGDWQERTCRGCHRPIPYSRCTDFQFQRNRQGLDPPKNIHNFMIITAGSRAAPFLRRSELQIGYFRNVGRATIQVIRPKGATLKLQWSELHISDDGVSLRSGSGFFRVELYQAGAASGDSLVVSHLTVFNTNDKLQHVAAVDGLRETGRQAIDNANRTVSMGLWGKSDRGWPVKDEIADNRLWRTNSPNSDWEGSRDRRKSP